MGIRQMCKNTYLVLFNMKTYDVIILTTSQSSKLGLVGHSYVINVKISSVVIHTVHIHTQRTEILYGSVVGSWGVNRSMLW